LRSDGGGRHTTKEGQTADEKQAARTKSQKTNKLKIQILNPKPEGRNSKKYNIKLKTLNSRSTMSSTQLIAEG
jgi:hypothetical protein